MSVVSILKSRDLYEFIQGKYPQDEFTRFSDGTYRSSCPIHGGTNESSFAVFPDNSWYCFSCNAGGNIIDYLMEREGLTYSAAVHELCQEYSVDLSQDSTFAEQQTIAQKYEGWCRSYEKDVGKCIEYLEKKRGLTHETIQQFRLGWSDRSHAITIPMFDANSREICAYGYRFFEGKAKYKNTKNIPGVFTKGEYLYNLDKCLGLMRKQKKLYVCEGHFDSIAGIQMGYPTVAYCGISLSKNHVELIRQYSSKLDGFQVVIIPDNDGKASKFVTRARELFQKHYSQASVKVLEITDEAIKDTNDILLAGKTFSDFPVHDIDIYCAREIIKAHHDDIQAQQKKIESYAKGITNPLTKADLAEFLSETWGKSLDVVKEFLRVSDVNTEDELMSDLSDIEDCFRAFDESLDEEEITFGYPALDANVTMRRSWVTIVGGYSFSGKCVDEDSLVKTEVGYKKIKDIEKGDRVVTFSEARNVLEFGTVMQKLDTGIKRGYKVKTRKGREVVVSEDHPFLTPSGWKKVKEGLSIGEQIATPNKLMNNGIEVLPKGEVELLALMIADGYCGNSLSYTKKDEEMISVMRNICRAYGTDIVKTSECSWRILCPGTHGITEVLRRHGLFGKRSWEKKIPESIFRTTKDLQRRFIELLFSGDGWVLSDEVGYSSSSEELVRGISSLLLFFGINSSMYSKSTSFTYKGERKEGRPAYFLLVTRENSVKFMEEFNLTKAKHRDIFSWKKTGRTYYDNIRISEETTSKIMDAYNGRHKEINKLIGKPLYSGRRGTVVPKSFTVKGFTSEKYRKIYEATGIEELKAISSEDLYFDEIVSIEDVGDRHMYDIEVSNGHNFVANDILVHNTQCLVDMCLHWTIRLHKRVLLFSLEMTKADILEVIIAKVMGIPQFTVKDFCKTKDGSKVFKEVSEKIGKYLHVVDKNSLSISDIDKYIQIFNMRNPDEPLDVAAVDYFGYLAHCDTFEEQSSSARKMKEIAKKNNVAFVMLSQFNKESQKGAMEPTQNALKGAGDIGASADVIILIWRPVISNPPENEIDREAIKYLTKLKVVKARKGLRNNQDRFELTYDPQTSRLEENK